MSKLAILGTAGLLQIPHFEITDRFEVETPYGKPSSALIHGLLQGEKIILLMRNSEEGNIPPHAINYRANIWALHKAGVSHILSIAPVNGIRADMIPGKIVTPDQIIDYTFDREHSFHTNEFSAAQHIDFRMPYTENFRQELIKLAHEHHIDLIEDGTYAVIQGPRLTTLAETNRLEKDGCHMTGMTAMPEAILARELDMHYSSLCIITHKAAGRRAFIKSTSQALSPVLKQGLAQLHQLIAQSVIELPTIISPINESIAID